MVVVVCQGKGRKDRLVPLSVRLLGELRRYWLGYHPSTWLFPGGQPGRPVHSGNVQRLFGRVRRRAGLTKRATSAAGTCSRPRACST
jgi:integrase